MRATTRAHTISRAECASHERRRTSVSLFVRARPMCFRRRAAPIDASTRRRVDIRPIQTGDDALAVDPCERYERDARSVRVVPSRA